jgi:hypothetical protein
MENRRYYNTLLVAIDLIHHNIGQSWHHPFERTGMTSGMAHKRK